MVEKKFRLECTSVCVPGDYSGRRRVGAVFGRVESRLPHGQCGGAGVVMNNLIRASRAMLQSNRENFSMNRHTFGAVLAATLGATLALASPTLLAAKPNADPCLQPGIDFPAFTYVRPIRSSGA